MKNCRRCQEDKSESEFYRDKKSRDGLRYHCIDCEKILRKEAYQKNKEKQLNQSRKWQKENYERVKEIKRNYRKRYREDPDNIKKDYARYHLNYLIRRGIVERPNTCERCGESTYVQAHHFDYNKPLDVMWLCVSCHTEVHNE